MNETYESAISFCVATQASLRFWFDVSGNKHVVVTVDWLGEVETSTIRQATKKLRSMMVAKRQEDKAQLNLPFTQKETLTEDSQGRKGTK